MRVFRPFLFNLPLESTHCFVVNQVSKRFFSKSHFSLDKASGALPSNPGSRVLKVAIIGCPNVGKSTVINQIVGRRVFAMSKKVHTTKCCARAVLNEGNTQVIFLDTPGLVSHKEVEKYKLDPTYFRGGEDAIVEADVIGAVHDVSNTFTREKLDPKVLRLLHCYKEKDSILILNKIDTLKSKRQLLNLSHNLTDGLLSKDNAEICPDKLSELDIQRIISDEPRWRNFSDVFMVSALLGNGIDDLRDYFLNLSKPGEWIFPSEAFTDKDPVKIIEEAVRSKLLEHLPNGVPYSCDVQLEYLDMDSEDLITAVVLVGCGTKKLEGLIKGFGGGRIRMIAMDAEQTIADAFLSNVHLQIIVQKKQDAKEMSHSG